MLLNCKKCLGVTNKIGKKSRDKSKNKKYHVLQFGDRNFFEYLLKIGLTPKKSKTLGKLKVPNKYFPHFLRGCIDGDGNISISKHPESKHPQCQIRLYSASKKFLEWILKSCRKNFLIKGGSISKINNSSIYSLKFGKSDSLKIVNRIYIRGVICLARKKEIAKRIMKIGQVA